MGSPLGAVAALFVVAVVVLVVFSIVYLATPKDNFVYEASVETDPASGEEIVFDNHEPEGADIIYVGFDDLLNSGFTVDQYELFKTVTEIYADVKLGQTLQRVSFEKDSLKITAPNVFNFNIVLNVDRDFLNVTYDASRSPATTEDISMNFQKNGATVWMF